MSYYKEIKNICFADGGYILLPEDESKKYPVVYMFHGIGGVDEWKDTEKGNIKNNMETIVDTGCVQSVIVMPKISGFGIMENNADIENLMAEGNGFVEADRYCISPFKKNNVTIQ